MMLNHFRVSLPVMVSYILIVYISCDDGPDKRILLSDSTYVQQQMTHLQGELQTIQATVQTQAGEISSLKQQLSLANNDGGGSTFVRWGRTDCPSNLTELVYSGLCDCFPLGDLNIYSDKDGKDDWFARYLPCSIHGPTSENVDDRKTNVFHPGYAGGSWYAHSGAATDYLCLPPDPEWLQTTVVPDDLTGRVYGAEYESSTGHTPFGSHSLNEEVPCAVCRSTSFISSVMIPAKTTCYSGWTKAYSGSLAAGYYGHSAASQFVCVDEHAQPLAGGADRNDNGKLFYGVKAFCGSLRCPPYEQDKYIACVVCMK